MNKEAEKKFLDRILYKGKLILDKNIKELIEDDIKNFLGYGFSWNINRYIETSFYYGGGPIEYGNIRLGTDASFTRFQILYNDDRVLSNLEDLVIVKGVSDVNSLMFDTIDFIGSSLSEKLER